MSSRHGLETGWKPVSQAVLKSFSSTLAEPAEAGWINFVIRKHLPHRFHRHAYVPNARFGEDGTEVGRDCQVASFEKLLRSKPRPVAEHLAATDSAAEGEEAGGVAVV